MLRTSSATTIQWELLRWRQGIAHDDFGDMNAPVVASRLKRIGRWPRSISTPVIVPGYGPSDTLDYLAWTRSICSPGRRVSSIHILIAWTRLAYQVVHERASANQFSRPALRINPGK